MVDCSQHSDRIIIPNVERLESCYCSYLQIAQILMGSCKNEIHKIMQSVLCKYMQYNKPGLFLGGRNFIDNMKNSSSSRIPCHKRMCSNDCNLRSTYLEFWYT